MRAVTVIRSPVEVTVKKEEGATVIKEVDYIQVNQKVVLSVQGAYNFQSPLSISYPNVSIYKASGSTDGYLSGADWTIFNDKQPAGNYVTEAPIDGNAYARKNASWVVGGGGITDHSLLSNLDYAHAGHTGFQPSGSYLTAVIADSPLSGDGTGASHLIFTNPGYITGITGSDVTTALGYTPIASIADPGINALFGWDDTDGAYKFIAIGTGLSYDHTTYTLYSTVGSGANTYLSNLASPTAINQDLIFVDGSDRTIGMSDQSIPDTNGNSFYVIAGYANGSAIGGSLFLTPGYGDSGNGNIVINDASGGYGAFLDTSLMSSIQTFSFPDNTGTFALTSDIPDLSAYFHKDGSDVATGDWSLGSHNLTTTGTLGAGAITGTSLTDSGLTNGRITFAGASGLLSDDSKLVWDNTNKRLGINIASPKVPLHVSIDGNVPPSTMYQANTDNFILSNQGSASIRMITAYDTSTAMGTIRATKARGTFASPTIIQSGDGIIRLQAMGYLPYNNGNYEAGRIQISASGTILDDDDYSAVPGQIDFYTTNSLGSSILAMSISNSQKLGIGITTPTAILHLKAGTATLGTSPLKYTVSGAVLLTTPETGAEEVDSSANRYFCPSTTVREKYAKGWNAGGTTTAGTTTTVTDARAKTTSTIFIQPTSAGFAGLANYISTKNNGSFVITTTVALGTETFDYLIVN